MFKGWDFKFSIESSAASLLEEWELQLATYMHNVMIVQKEVRRTFSGNPLYMGFIFKEIRRWSTEKETREPYCLLLELNSNNTC